MTYRTSIATVNLYIVEAAALANYKCSVWESSHILSFTAAVEGRQKKELKIQWNLSITALQITDTSVIRTVG